MQRSANGPLRLSPRLLQLALLAAALWCGLAGVVSAQTAQWIWSGERNDNNRLPATVYFRKSDRKSVV